MDFATIVPFPRVLMVPLGSLSSDLQLGFANMNMNKGLGTWDVTSVCLDLEPGLGHAV